MADKKISERFKERLSHTDQLLFRLSCIALILTFVTLIPPLRAINGWWYLLVAVVLAAKPLYTALKK